MGRNKGKRPKSGTTNTVKKEGTGDSVNVQSGEQKEKAEVKETGDGQEVKVDRKAKTEAGENRNEKTDKDSSPSSADGKVDDTKDENQDTKEETMESPREEGKKKRNKKKKDTPEQTVEKLMANEFKDCHEHVIDLIKLLGDDEDGKKFLIKGVATGNIMMLSNFCSAKASSDKDEKEPTTEEKTKGGKRRLRGRDGPQDREQDLQTQVKELESKNAELSMKFKITDARNQKLKERLEKNETDSQAIRNLEAKNEDLSERLQRAETKITGEVETNKKLSGRMAQLEEENAKYLMNQTKVRELIEKLEVDVDQKNSELTGLKEELAHQMQEAQTYKVTNINLKESNRSLKDELKEMTADRDAFKERFSQLAGAKLTTGNAEITDLSDENRPQKLAEKFSELYDNQWTDAYEELMDNHGMSEDDTIKALLEILKDCVALCRMKAEEQEMCLIQDVLDDLSLAKDNVPTETLCNGEDRNTATESTVLSSGLALQDTKTLKDMRKAYGSRTLPVLQKLMRKQIEEKGDYVKGPLFRDYVEKCVEISWYSCIQDPPLDYEFDFPHGAEFDPDLMKTYTKKGSIVDFMVWPLLRLYINGAILAKGVVQPVEDKKSKKSAA